MKYFINQLCNAFPKKMQLFWSFTFFFFHLSIFKSIQKKLGNLVDRTSQTNKMYKKMQLQTYYNEYITTINLR
jgi:hypothetical protein